MKGSLPSEYGSFAEELESQLMNFTTITEEERVGTYLPNNAHKENSDHRLLLNPLAIKMDCSVSWDRELVEEQHSDATECSSSFNTSDFSDTESDLNSGGSHDKLTTVRKNPSLHWRAFIRPIMWRCKWLELQIHRLEAQAKKCDGKLTSLPSHGTSKVARRKKRRRAEETNELATYMSDHILFSYYENRKKIQDASFHVLKNPVCTERKVVLVASEEEGSIGTGVENGNEDDDLLDQTLRRIEHLHSRVRTMKTRVGKVIDEHGGKVSCTDDSSLVDACYSPPSSPLIAGKFGADFASQLISENNGSLLFPKRSDTKQNGHDRFTFPHESEDNAVLIDNPIVKDEMHYLELLKLKTNGKPRVGPDQRPVVQTYRPR